MNHQNEVCSVERIQTQLVEHFAGMVIEPLADAYGVTPQELRAYCELSLQGKQPPALPEPDPVKIAAFNEMRRAGQAGDPRYYFLARITGDL